MAITFKAKIKSITAKDNGTVIQLEPQAAYAGQVAELMAKVGMHAFGTIDDEQMELVFEDSAEAEYDEIRALPEGGCDEGDE